ncbi:MAG TPA: carboxypeptidase-like regulatory domain-containing protein, partial [Thermoanaerobaculaceae bacterium]|nr:carboxypeptidase-like regulatory domain-containing protein [Thermoanaerobaculaceae bacterium]
MKSTNVHRRPTLALAVALASLLIGSTILAQGAVVTLVGTVSTRDGIGLPGVTITLDGPSGAQARVVSGEEGVWSAAGLAAGTWSVRAELAGFATATASGLELAAGRTRHVEIKLAPAAFFDTTAVTGKAPEDLLSAGEIRETAARELDDAFTK